MKLFQTLRDRWNAVTGARPKRMTGVHVHDPAASGPRDLDDPFFDAKVQARIAEVIARSATSKAAPKTEAKKD